jgi:hypothetical protein
MANIDENINIYWDGTPGAKPVVTNVSGVRNGYYGETIASVAGVANYVWLNDAKTLKAKGWELYVNDETNSYQTGDIVTYDGVTYTVGPIKKPTLNVKKANFFNTTDISGDPIGGMTMGNTRKARVFDISINLI